MSKLSAILIIVINIILLHSCTSSSKNNILNMLEDEPDILEEVDIQLTQNEIEGNLEPAVGMKSHELLLTDVYDEKSAVEDFHSIIEEAQKENPNYQIIEEIYENGYIKEVAKIIDKEYRKWFDSRICNYIKIGQNNNKYSKLDKLLESTLMLLFRTAIQYELSLSYDNKIFELKTSDGGSPNHWDKAYIYSKVFETALNNAYEHSGDEALSFSEIESHFIKGSYYVYEFDNDSCISLYIESQRIEKKIMKAFFIMLSKYIDMIINDKFNKDYESVITNVIHARGYFDMLSYGIGNDNMRGLILKEIGKTMTLKKDIVINNTIIYIFYNEMELNLYKLKQTTTRNMTLKIVWEAYFLYYIFEDYYSEKMGAEAVSTLQDEWAYLITVCKEMSRDSINYSVNKILDILSTYQSSIEISTYQ